MKKVFKTGMALLLAISMVFGNAPAVFAAESGAPEAADAHIHAKDAECTLGIGSPNNDGVMTGTVYAVAPTMAEEEETPNDDGEACNNGQHSAMPAERENEVAATCTTPGSYDRVVRCKECKSVISRETVTTSPALGHTAGEAVKENEKAATCTEEGSYDSVVYCTVCKSELSRETVKVDALGHTVGAAVKENVTTAGSYDEVQYCTVCKAEIPGSRKTIQAPKPAPKAQGITIKKISASYKVAAVKKAAKTFSIGATAKTSVTAKKVSGSKKITVSSAGKVKIAKGTKKGTYTAKVKLTASSSSSYKAATKTVNVTVKVK